MSLQTHHFDEDIFTNSIVSDAIIEACAEALKMEFMSPYYGWVIFRWPGRSSPVSLCKQAQCGEYPQKKCNFCKQGNEAAKTEAGLITLDRPSL